MGGPGGCFLAPVPAVALPLLLPVLKPPPGPPKPPPAQFSSWGKFYTMYFWTGTLTKGRDYSVFLLSEAPKKYSAYGILRLSNDFLMICQDFLKLSEDFYRLSSDFLGLAGVFLLSETQEKRKKKKEKKKRKKKKKTGCSGA